MKIYQVTMFRPDYDPENLASTTVEAIREKIHGGADYLCQSLDAAICQVIVMAWYHWTDGGRREPVDASPFSNKVLAEMVEMVDSQVANQTAEHEKAGRKELRSWQIDLLEQIDAEFRITERYIPEDK